MGMANSTSERVTYLHVLLRCLDCGRCNSLGCRRTASCGSQQRSGLGAGLASSHAAGDAGSGSSSRVGTEHVSETLQEGAGHQCKNTPAYTTRQAPRLACSLP